MKDRSNDEFQIVILLGIIRQLLTTRQNSLLKKYGLSISQYALLTHLFRHQHKYWTVSRLSEVMEINQPGVTKICNNLIQMGYVTATDHASDRRIRYLSISKQGLTIYQDITDFLKPHIKQMFTDWGEDELKQFMQSLDKLMHWLDNNRLP